VAQRSNPATETIINVRIPAEMHEEVRRRAEDEDRTLSQVGRRALKLYLQPPTPGPAELAPRTGG